MLVSCAQQQYSVNRVSLGVRLSVQLLSYLVWNNCYVVLFRTSDTTILTKLTYRVAHEMSYHFIIPLKLCHHSIDVANVRVNAVVHGKCDRCHQFVKWRTTGG